MTSLFDSEEDMEWGDAGWDGEAWSFEARRPPRRPPGRRPQRQARPERPPPKRPPFPPPVRTGKRFAVRREPWSECAPQASEYMRWVQSTLAKALGRPLRISGFANSETREAIREFQRREGLPVDGIAGPETKKALMAARAQRARTAEESETGGEWEGEVNRRSREYVRWVQRALNRILGLRLAVDGILGPQTRSAVRAFQGRSGLAADGIVGPLTEAALIKAGAGTPPQQPSAPTPTPGTVPPVDVVTVRGIRIARQIAPQLGALLAAAQADGVPLSGWGHRSSQRQIELRRKHCGPTHYDIYEKPSSQCTPPTARPGRSMHERGLAVDFTYNGQGINSHSNPGFRWLERNAPRFGFYNLPSEPWHWSINGR